MKCQFFFALLFAAILPVATYADDTPEAWNIKSQATYIQQQKPYLNAAYSGPNSLSTQAEKGYSFTGTMFFGLRTWQGGELYFDPEVVQAEAISNLTGSGGLTNSEQQKTGSPKPVFYPARLFVRQTWSLGGEKELVNSAANKLAGMTDKRRVLLTVGNISPIDIFDNNAYAHDARTQFLNWALLTHGAFDYAADARGYTWGVASEYYYYDWAFRAGRFMVPSESNGLQLDNSILNHYGDQLELEHAHTVTDQPGKLRLLVFRNKAFMGGYQDALAIAPNNGGVPSVALVRKERMKYGLGISLEQSVSSDIGIFGRGSWNDGASETYSFTEIDNSMSAGVSVKGMRWGRKSDTFAFALVQNGLSNAHRDYLAAGGLGFFLGDGRLNYRPEQIIETYYDINLAKNTSGMLDLQQIYNPAYNADRGPAMIISMRLHTEF